jgi:hypothetical protein
MSPYAELFCFFDLFLLKIFRFPLLYGSLFDHETAPLNNKAVYSEQKSFSIDHDLVGRFYKYINE